MTRCLLKIYRVCVFGLYINSCSAQNFVTYQKGPGRFGDQLVSYIHAQWVSYKYKFPLLYKPFKYSDQLKLHDLEKVFLDTQACVKTIQISKNQPINFNGDGILYIIPYFPHYPKSFVEGQRMMCPLVVDWQDYGFVDLLRTLISPKQTIELPLLSPDCLNVALHVRTGGGYDKVSIETGLGKKSGRHFADVCFPISFPRDEFYIAQLTWLLTFFERTKIYVYVFTDDQDPGALCDRYHKAINNKNICFDCRKTGNHHDKNVLEDFFAMQLFDCIICPNSNYSITASKIGHNFLTIFPVSYEWHGADLVITRAKVDVKLRELQNVVDRQLLETTALFKLLTA